MHMIFCWAWKELLPHSFIYFNKYKVHRKLHKFQMKGNIWGLNIYLHMHINSFKKNKKGGAGHDVPIMWYHIQPLACTQQSVQTHQHQRTVSPIMHVTMLGWRKWNSTATWICVISGVHICLQFTQSNYNFPGLFQCCTFRPGMDLFLCLLRGRSYALYRSERCLIYLKHDGLPASWDPLLLRSD